MSNIKYKTIIGVIILLTISKGTSYLPVLRIEIQKDSVHIGEPIILKCWLVNNNNVLVKIWDKTPTDLLSFGYIEFYLISEKNDTSRYAIGITVSKGSHIPKTVIQANDSLYWYMLLGWHNFARSDHLMYQPGLFKIIAQYWLTVKDENADSFPYSAILSSNEETFIATAIPNSERQIYDEWIPLTREYFWWGERFERCWVRKDYNELCKQVAETKSRFAIYAHYIYCKSTGDKEAMKRFLSKYREGPLSEMVDFLLNTEVARKKYPKNFFAK